LDKDQSKLATLPDLFPLVFPPLMGASGEEYSFYFSCGEGWYTILYEMAEKLTPIIRAYLKKYPESSASIHDIKEKYGTLSIHYTGPVEMDKIISVAEDQSAEICEICGKRGSLRGKSWYYVACYSHTKVRDR